MEAPSIVSRYVYEKTDNGLKGGYPWMSKEAHVGGSAQYGHLAIPIGIVVISEHSVPITHYDEDIADGYLDEDVFDSLLSKVGHREHHAHNITKKHDKGVSKKSTKKHHRSL